MKITIFYSRSLITMPKLRIVDDGGTEWLIGTSGFMCSQKEWSKYTELTCIEINSSFYKLPTANQITNLAKMPMRVSFVFKLSNYISHCKKLSGEYESHLVAFLQSILVLRDRTKAILLQFPNTFKFNEENVFRLNRFYGIWKKSIKLFNINCNLAIEFRDKSWFEAHDESLDRLSDNGVIFVNVWVIKKTMNGYIGNLPNGISKVKVLENSNKYIRLHGSLGYRGSYKKDDLMNLKALCSDKKSVFVFFNNTFFYGNTRDRNIADRVFKHAAIKNAVELGMMI